VFKKILIANRGEIAIRIARACADMRIRSIAVHSDDDAASLHVRRADEARALSGIGARAYLDIGQVLEAAALAGADAIHPGYGFLSESTDFARACTKAGIAFIGPPPETLALFGDKARARTFASDCGLPVLRGAEGSATEAKAFLESLGRGAAMMIKAVAGGGGRGMRAVSSAQEIDPAYRRCAAEAKAAFGSDGLYFEERLERARHIEVQIAGDGAHVAHFHDRECTIQRRNQKLIEVAPAPHLPDSARAALHAAAVKLGEAAKLETLATIEFLLDAGEPERFFFIEANPRLQVEHTVTEEALGIDLVRLQIELAAGGKLPAERPAPRGFAIQARVLLETTNDAGDTAPADGELNVYEPPTGPGVRVDSAGFQGYAPNPNFDSLVAKVTVSGADFEHAAKRTARALGEFRLEGTAHNLGSLRAVLTHRDFLRGKATTRFFAEHAADFAKAQHEGATVTVPRQTSKHVHAAPPGATAVEAPLRGTIVELSARVGDHVRKGAQLAVLEAMKMQHVVPAPVAGTVRLVAAQAGDTVSASDAILYLDASDVSFEEEGPAEAFDLDELRADLAEAMTAIAKTLDESRPDAVARRRKTGQRTARENIADLVDPGSFIEYGALAVAAQRRRRTLEDLIDNTPADGIVAGIASINSARFPEDRARAAVLAYDYTVLAGTQGYFNHKKTDRVLDTAERWALPIVFFVEGGGGRPGDTDVPGVAGLDVPSFAPYARLSGLAPRIGIASGRCFAGNAAFFGCSDITIATRDANIGMGGPAMIEGGGLGVYKSEEIGPTGVQFANGVIDVLVDDEAAATAAAKTLLAFFQGTTPDWAAADQRLLRRAVPENRVRAYQVRPVIETLVDTGSFVELRGGYGVGIVTGLARIEGRPIGIAANNPQHLGGAIDAEAAEKAARFLQLCDAFDVPIVSLVDTPGFMVGPEHERFAGVRRMSSLFVVGATLAVPLFAIVLRKSYGLGAQAMAGGSTHRPFFMASWPTGEFGGMGLEGAVRLGYRKELAAETDPELRDALFKRLVANMYEHGKAVSMARALEIDAVIDPKDTRAWLIRGLKSSPPPTQRSGKKRPFIDTW